MIKAQCTGFINTPPLWEKQQFDIQQFEFPDVAVHTFQPNPIPQNIRLGHQIEYIFKHLVTYSQAYEVVLYNLPISQGKRTLGEIDFILKDKTSKQLIHVELTYKFYILAPDFSNPIHCLIGPNKRDSFFAKMEKIKHKQFPLLHSEAGIQALSDNNINHLAIEHQCCFKAQLFQPFDSKAVDIGVLNKACMAGYWLSLKEFNTVEFATAQFYMPPKSEWVIEPHHQVIWKSHLEIILDIKRSLLQKRAPMIWRKKPNNEFEKFFVV